MTNVRYAALARLRDGVPLFSYKQNADAEVRRGLRGARRNTPATCCPALCVGVAAPLALSDG